MSGVFSKIEASFKAAINGQELTDVLIKKWGIIAYVVTYFVANRLVLEINNHLIDVIISLLVIIYFVWHIFVLRKCSPKKPKLTKEEKAYLRHEARKNFGKKFLKKILLQEPWTRWNPVTVTIVVDVLCITHFVGYLVK